MVLDVPIVIVRPLRNSTSPRAKRAESKRNITPRNKNTHPRNSRPVPILALSEIIFAE